MREIEIVTDHFELQYVSELMEEKLVLHNGAGAVESMVDSINLYLQPRMYLKSVKWSMNEQGGKAKKHKLKLKNHEAKAMAVVLVFLHPFYAKADWRSVCLDTLKMNLLKKLA